MAISKITSASLTDGVNVSFNAGSAAAPSISPAGDTNTGIFFPAADVTAIATGGTERARITSGGNFLLGSTVGGSDERMWVETTNADWCIQTNNTGSGTFYHISFRANNTQVGAITSNTTTTTYATSSDYRLKENIAPMSGALAKVSQLKPCTYTWKTDGSTGQGFIAHELQAVVPECVVGEKDAVQTYTDEDGNEQTRPVYQGVDTSFLVATLTAAIQELKAINDAQASRIETLEAKVAALEEQ